MADEDRIAPVALPAGSFEVLELRDELDKAVGVKGREKHPERINAAIAKCIKQPETLANLDTPAVPLGAKLVDQPIVYVEGQEPVTRDAIAFDAVEAKDGTEASGMRYEHRRGNVDEVVATDKPPGQPVELEDEPATLSEQAAEHVEESETGDSSSSGAKSR